MSAWHSTLRLLALVRARLCLRYEVPNSYRDRFPDIADGERRTYAGMVSAMDDAVGNVTEAFNDAGV